MIDSSDEKKDFSILNILQILWEQKRIIVIATVTFFFIALVHVITAPKEYTSKVTVMPEASSGMDNQSLRSLAGLTGISLGSAVKSKINPDLYPKIVASTPYYLALMEAKFKISDDADSVKLIEYLRDYNEFSILESAFRWTKNLPGSVLGLILRGGSKRENIVRKKDEGVGGLKLTLSADQRRAISLLKNRVDVRYEYNTGLIVVMIEMPTPHLSADVAIYSVKYLTDYTTAYKTEKETRNLEFLESQHMTLKTKFRYAQNKLAEFKDKNQNVITSNVRMEEQNLQSEYTLNFNLYNNISQQVAQAKINLQNVTPIFKVLEPAETPSNNSSPNSKLILVISLFLGIGLSSLFVLVRIMISNNSLD